MYKVVRPFLFFMFLQLMFWIGFCLMWQCVWEWLSSWGTKGMEEVGEKQAMKISYMCTFKTIYTLPAIFTACFIH
jgi:hypothetical protein